MKYSVFIDIEKEAVGRGELTLFVFDPEQDVIGNIAGEPEPYGEPARCPPTYSARHLLGLARRGEFDRVYLGARETEVDPELIQLFKGEFRVTFETSSHELACAMYARHAESAGVVLRIETPTWVKVKSGKGVAYVRADDLLWDDTEVGPHDVADWMERNGRTPETVEEMLAVPGRFEEPPFNSGREAWDEAFKDNPDAWKFETARLRRAYEGKRFASIIRALGAAAPSSEPVWDAACHEGHCAAYLAARRVHVSRVSDISPVALARAVERLDEVSSHASHDARESHAMDLRDFEVIRRDAFPGSMLLAEVLYSFEVNDWQNFVRNLCASARRVVMQHCPGAFDPRLPAGAVCLDREFGIYVVTADDVKEDWL